MPSVSVDRLLQRAAVAGPPTERPSSRLKSQIYSALQAAQQEGGPLLSLSETDVARGKLCVFEELVRIVPVGETIKEKNPCRICHARILAEHIEHAPIYWPGCPYVRFQGR